MKILQLTIKLTIIGCGLLVGQSLCPGPANADLAGKGNGGPARHEVVAATQKKAVSKVHSKSHRSEQRVTVGEGRKGSTGKQRRAK